MKAEAADRRAGGGRTSWDPRVARPALWGLLTPGELGSWTYGSLAGRRGHRGLPPCPAPRWVENCSHPGVASAFRPGREQTPGRGCLGRDCSKGGERRPPVTRRASLKRDRGPNPRAGTPRGAPIPRILTTAPPGGFPSSPLLPPKTVTSPWATPLDSDRS